MDIFKDERIVLTLDAGGTNFSFSAVQAGEIITEPINLPANSTDLNKCIFNIFKGFVEVKNRIHDKPSAISFAFPGPADYPNGIIGDLGNLPAFRGGVPLGPMLADKFNIPVFINNDGDLFAYGEAIAGFLPKVNNLLSKAGSPKRYKNLLGVTLGTGFGGGLVLNKELFIGDNSAGAEIWCVRNKLYPDKTAEESISIRGLKLVYSRDADISFEQTPEPKDIYEIALGSKQGNKEAAQKAFYEMAEVLGDALSNAVTLIDGLVVIGGGLAGAHSVFLSETVREMNNKLLNGTLPRTELKVYNLEDPEEKNSFINSEVKEIKMPDTNAAMNYDPLKRTGVGISTLGTSKAVAIGAYAYAVNRMGEQ